ncbi:TPA: hypothetical protein VIT50_000693 [Streptococcus pyogenes]|uniref:hypothetical protein n=1 Tax=Streptococcus pyogenes TaxID=1314 RepID=UPI0010DDAB84|nr:hypothetical protein [Streptococcus pyogenes]VGR97682.1 hypothetical membrane associated protein [Streptococcus pyogenes]VGU37305.1 hypothetical membrane associated protein [Streptococcus pyogenes]HEQ9922707.1 hypothetical protein [Streptococcus pyogenes]
MKTKSKRFLNLATLCLALLGTTLLIEQPVKAEGMEARSEEQVTERRQFGNYKEDHERGRKEGYEAGSKPGAPEHPTKTREYDPDSRDVTNGYNDGYGYGYSEGWNESRWHGSHGKDAGPSDNPQERPSDNPQERPSDNPQERPSDNPQERPSDNPQEKGSQEGTREKGKSGSEQDGKSQESQESILDLEPIFETIVKVFEWIYTWVFSA